MQVAKRRGMKKIIVTWRGEIPRLAIGARDRR